MKNNQPHVYVEILDSGRPIIAVKPETDLRTLNLKDLAGEIKYAYDQAVILEQNWTIEDRLQVQKTMRDIDRVFLDNIPEYAAMVSAEKAKDQKEN